MRIQDLMKEENWGKVYECSGDKLKFENNKLYVKADSCGWCEVMDTLNSILEFEFTEVKQPYTFTYAVNDDEYEYYPEGHEPSKKCNNAINWALSAYLVDITEGGENTKRIINGNWYRK